MNLQRDKGRVNARRAAPLKERSFQRVSRVSRCIREFPHCVHTLWRGTDSPRGTVVTHSRFIIKGGNLRRGVFVRLAAEVSK